MQRAHNDVFKYAPHRTSNADQYRSFHSCWQGQHTPQSAPAEHIYLELRRIWMLLQGKVWMMERKDELFVANDNSSFYTRRLISCHSRVALSRVCV